MRIVKTILGMLCLLGAVYLGLFTLAALYWLKLILAGLTLGQLSIGIYLISKRGGPISITAKRLMGLFFCLLVLLPVLLDLQIRHERKALQERAVAFLARPIPNSLIPDARGEVGGYYVDTNAGIANGVFGYSRTLIERYATKGRIRWSAAIQGEFACTGDSCLNMNISDAVITNEEVRRYSAESHAILAEEWRMGYWQWVEDTIEMKAKIPEIEEEDQYNGWIEQLCGTWTNANFETMTISNNGVFSARWVSAAGTNIFKGTEVFMGGASTLQVIRDTEDHNLHDGDEKNLKILHVDDRHLDYEVDGQTNRMSR